MTCRDLSLTTMIGGPWTFFFLTMSMLIFAVHRYGRSLGFDAVIAARPGRSRLLDWMG